MSERSFFGILALCLLATLPLPAEPPSTQTLQGEGYQGVDFIFSQPARTWSALLGPEGAVLLVWLGSEKKEESSSLYGLSPGASSFELWLEIPGGVLNLEPADLDGDGLQELLLEGEDGLSVAYRNPQRSGFKPPVKLLGSDGLRLEDRIFSSSKNTLAFAQRASLDRYMVEAASLNPRDALALPVRVTRHSTRLDLTSPEVLHLGTVKDKETYLTEALEVEDSRFSCRLLSPESEAQEVWGQFPRPAKIVKQWPLRWRDRPVLALTTRDSQKLGLLEKIRLEVYPLRPDLSHQGYSPFFDIDTRSRSWQKMEVYVEELHGSSAEDLVVIQTEGLGSQKIQLDVYPGTPSGFSHRAVRWELKDAPRWSYLNDVTGDGLGDLLVEGESGSRLYLSERSRKGPFHKKRFLEWPKVAKEVQQVVSVTVGSAGSTVDRRVLASWARVETVDWDGDGQREIILAGRIEEVGWYLRIISVETTSQ